MPILQVQNLLKTFTTGLWPFAKRHQFIAVNSISFELNKGEILGFLGTNGAGKTTTIHMLLNILTPTSGTISYFGKDLKKNPIALLKKVSYASGYDKLPSRLTIWENLDIIGRIYSLPSHHRRERIEHLLKFFDMWHMRNKPTGMLSAGQSTRVSLAKAFLPNPEIILLDEPTAALDPESALQVREFILKEQREQEVSILFTSHNMAEVAQVCDRVLVLKQGTIIANNTPEQLARSVSHAHINLIITIGLKQLVHYLQEKKLSYTLGEHSSIDIWVDEQTIAELLMAFAERKISYAQISINKPTLEDYFISISKK